MLLHQYQRQQQNRRAVFSVLLAGLLAAMLFLAVFYLAREAGHDCCGTGCPVCACMEQCEHFLESPGGAEPVSVALPLRLVLFLILLLLILFQVIFSTPVTRKVRCNN